MGQITLALAVAFALAGCNKNSGGSGTASAPAPAAAEAPSSAARPAASTATAAAGDGQAVFSRTCVACHGTGVAGAPKLGDKADWGPRIAQGKDALYTHALQGFTGTKGVMPPKGGNAPLSDPEVKAAVDYMASQAQ
jgi:cytochrome c5